MKKEINVPLLKVEDFVAANLRRDNYALKRDQQNSEFNEAIVTRLRAAENTKTKCEKCGREFTTENISTAPPACPQCSL
jgi:Zn finger protein HypA/HybF involved in hydrogenase expression